jgi:hypothetical protein
MGTASVILRATSRIGYSWTAPALAGAYGIGSCAAAIALATVRPTALIEFGAGWLTLWAATVAIALACSGQWYVHERFREADFVQHNEVGGFIIAVAGALYSVLLGFMTVIAWQHFSDARQLVAAESSAAIDAWHTAVGMPQPQRSRIRNDVLTYADAMVNAEWPAMRGRSFDRESDLTVMDAIGTAGAFNPRNLMEANAQSATLQQLSTLHDERYRRLSDNDSAMSWFEWAVLLAGGTCIVAFCWLFGLKNKAVHLLMTSAVTIIIATTLVLLFELQFPFRSDLRIAPDDWTAAIAHIHTMQAASQSGMRM